MAFYLYFAAGIVGGLFGGMGMGGGTLFIPILTLFLGVEQQTAQCINLIAFLPMAFVALPVHAKNGLLKTNGILSIILPAIVLSLLGSLLAVVLPSDVLRRGFGIFLIVLSVIQFTNLRKNAKIKT